jgi:hypothetical protein
LSGFLGFFSRDRLLHGGNSVLEAGRNEVTRFEFGRLWQRLMIPITRQWERFETQRQLEIGMRNDQTGVDGPGLAGSLSLIPIKLC